MYPDLIEAIVYEKTKKATQKKFNKLLDDYQVRLSQSMLAKLHTRTPMVKWDSDIYFQHANGSSSILVLALLLALLLVLT